MTEVAVDIFQNAPKIVQAYHAAARGLVEKLKRFSDVEEKYMFDAGGIYQIIAKERTEAERPLRVAIVCFDGSLWCQATDGVKLEDFYCASLKSYLSGKNAPDKIERKSAFIARRIAYGFGLSETKIKMLRL